jgi:hypothetical protein
VQWWESTRDWIAIASGQDLRVVGKEQFVIDFADEHIWVEGLGDIVSTQIEVLQIGAVHPVSSIMLDDVVQRVAAGEDPPLALQIYHDAKTARRDDHLRRAVIDAGVACELSMVAMIEARLGGAEAAVRDALLSRYTTLRGRADLLHKLGVNRPDGLRRFIDLRNRATHEGYSPTNADVDLSLEIVADIILRAFPAAPFNDGSATRGYDPLHV